jgi:hypothetical protein
MSQVAAVQRAMHLIDHHRQPSNPRFIGDRAQLPEGVKRQGRQQPFIVEVQEPGGLEHIPNQGRLPRLPGADDVDHPARLKRSRHLARQVPRKLGPFTAL